MQLINRPHPGQFKLWVLLCLLFFSPLLLALESDRQATLQVDADNTDGPLGDGTTTLWGGVSIRQGTLHIKADKAEVKKADGRVKSVILYGKPAFLEQEMEDQGLVQATANIIDYQVASGLVTLTGSSDVKHPQYQVSGELLTYDLNTQHFKGSSDGDGNGRIHILLDPEVIKGGDEKQDGQDKQEPEESNNPIAPQTPVSDMDKS